MKILTGVLAIALALSAAAAAFAQTKVTAQPYIGGYQSGPGPYYGGTSSAQQKPAQPYIGGYQSATAQPYIGGYGATAPAPKTAQSASTK
jgi:opacity protein-like surface antigen